MSPLEKAIADIPKTGWLMNGLGKSPLDSPQPWSVDLVPSYFGIYQWGEPDKSGPYTVYPMAQARITGGGATALAAIQDALAKLAKSEAKAIYDDLIRAFEDAVDGFNG
jgi:hypothetical protein